MQKQKPSNRHRIRFQFFFEPLKSVKNNNNETKYHLKSISLLYFFQYFFIFL